MRIGPAGPGTISGRNRGASRHRLSQWGLPGDCKKDKQSSYGIQLFILTFGSLAFRSDQTKAGVYQSPEYSFLADVNFRV